MAIIKVVKCLRCQKVLSECRCVGRQTDGTFKEQTIASLTKEQLIALIDERIELKK